MRNALVFFGTLRDTDIDWLIGTGRKILLTPGERLIEQGAPLDALYLVLEGRLGVIVRGATVAALQPGEIVGEMSFLDGSTPSATVSAAEPSTVLAIDRSRLESRIARDDGFAARIYRSLAVTVADRLRTTTLRAAAAARGAKGGDDAPGAARQAMDEIPMELLERSTVAAQHFSEILRRTGGRS